MAPVRLCLLRVNGGIVGLAAWVTEHSGAVECDLLTRTGHELRDVGDALSWSALASFILHRDPAGAIAREIDGDFSVWATTSKTNGLLADIFDMLAQINANLVAIGEHSKTKPVPRYPRPGMEQEDAGNVKRFGHGALPRGQFRKWLEDKRKERNGERS